MLQFIGSGSAFNTKLGNNSAFYKEGNQLLLIDCGSNIFERIKESNLLEGIDHVHVLVTHTHADHVGSLADLIFYCFYSHGNLAETNVSVYAVQDTNVGELLKINGCIEDEHYYGYHHIEKMETRTPGEPSFNELDFYFFESKHVGELKAYGVSLNIRDTLIYYSGDSSSLNINDVFMIRDDYDIAYIDTCSADYPGNVHLSLRELSETITEKSVREKIWCMHLDAGFEREEAEKAGFNVVKNIFEG